jgi:hypothetical protein
MATVGAVIVDIQAKHSKFSKGVSTAQKDFKKFQKTVKSGVELFALVEGFGRVREAVSSVNPQLGQMFKHVENLVMITKSFGTAFGAAGVPIGAGVALITSAYQSYMQDLKRIQAEEEAHLKLIDKLADTYRRLAAITNPFGESTITAGTTAIVSQLQSQLAALQAQGAKIGDDYTYLGMAVAGYGKKLGLKDRDFADEIKSGFERNVIAMDAVRDAIQQAKTTQQQLIRRSVVEYARDADEATKKLEEVESKFLDVIAAAKQSKEYGFLLDGMTPERGAGADIAEAIINRPHSGSKNDQALVAAAERYLKTLKETRAELNKQAIADSPLIQQMKQVESFIMSTQDNLAQMDMSDKQLKLLDLKELGASKSQIKMASDLLDQIASKERANQLKTAGEQLAESLQTPVEQYKDRLAELDEMLEANAISQETYARAVKQAEDNMQGTARSAFALQDAGTVVRRFDFAMVQSPTKPSDPMQRMLSVEQQQLAQSQRQTKALERLSKGGLEVMSIAG